MKDVLVIRFSSLGDVVIASAVLEAIHTALPACRITLLTKQDYAPLFEGDSRVSRLIGIRSGEPPSAITHRTGATFDAVVDLHGSLRSIAITTLLHSPRKLRVRKHSLARRIMIWSRNRYRRRFDVLGSYLETVRPLGVAGRALPRLYPGDKSLTEAQKLLSDYRPNQGKVIGIAPGSLHPEKRWSPESYALLADRLVARGDVPLFIGDTRDTGFVNTIISRMTGSAVSLAGSIDLSLTVGVISLLDGLVCNDSGPMHLAGALDVPFAALFGPTHPDLGFVPGYPYGSVVHSNVSCSPCSLHGRTPCRYESRRCMEGITG
ncbi:MAG: glycosyltransferase family 9 protein, partial [Candidatus Latescibacterota bacterium]